MSFIQGALGWMFGKKKKKPVGPTAEQTAAAGPYGDTSQVGRLGRLQVGAEGERGGLSSFLRPQYEALATGEGYSPEEQSAITQESLGSVGNTFDVYRDRATNRVARTGNTAGYGSLLSEMAREEGRQKGSVTRQNMISFADEKQRRRFAGLAGLAQMFGIDTSFLSNLLAQSTSIQGIREGKKPTSLEKMKFGKDIAGDVIAGIFGMNPETGKVGGG